jgi:hypothetical protein
MPAKICEAYEPPRLSVLGSVHVLTQSLIKSGPKADGLLLLGQATTTS